MILTIKFVKIYKHRYKLGDRDMRTLIEFCDNEPVHNIMMCLQYMPSRLVFIGLRVLMTEEKKKKIKSILNIKGWKGQIEFIAVNCFDIESTVTAIERVVNGCGDCGIDLTGGSELTLLALGIASKASPLNIYQVDVPSGEINAVMGRAEPPKNPLPSLSVSETVTLYGGKVKQNLKRPEPTEELLNDLDIMWSIYQSDFVAWKSQTEAFMNAGGYRGELAKINTRESRVFKQGVFDRLKEAGMVCECSEKEGILSFRFKNKDVHKLLADTGSILELQVLRAAKLLPQTFTDAVACVVIDWDGVINNGFDNKDTLNEIDGILMRNMVPTFVSCKSGNYDRNSLYELDVVTHRFGGEYAVKLLVVNDPKQVKGSDYIRQRAADMGIKLLENAYTYSACELAEKLAELTE